LVSIKIYIVDMNNLIKKLLYRSNHRGTKEMDLLIGGFAIENLKKLSPEELKEFELLLNFTDKELSSWLVDNKKNIDLENFSISKKIKEFKLQF
jgi:antitoxin CptB